LSFWEKKKEKKGKFEERLRGGGPSRAPGKGRVLEAARSKPEKGEKKRKSTRSTVCEPKVAEEAGGGFSFLGKGGEEQRPISTLEKKKKGGGDSSLNKKKKDNELISIWKGKKTFPLEGKRKRDSVALDERGGPFRNR